MRRRRAGTFVAVPRVEETVLEIHDIAAEVRAAGRRYDFDRLRQRRRPASGADARRLKVDEDAPVLAIQGVHRANGAPIALEERLINLRTVPHAAGQSFAGIAPGSWLLEEVPWTEAEHEIEAVNADPAAATLLAVQPGGACLRVMRRTWRGADSVTWVRLTFPGERHKLTGRFRAKSAVKTVQT
jgi:GntR family histidine utilization transcriptional repressor